MKSASICLCAADTKQWHITSLCLCLEAQWKDNNEFGILQISIWNQGACAEFQKRDKGTWAVARATSLGFVCLCLSPLDRNLLEHLPCVRVAGEVSWLTCQSARVVRSRVSRRGLSLTAGETWLLAPSKQMGFLPLALTVQDLAQSVFIVPSAVVFPSQVSPSDSNSTKSSAFYQKCLQSCVQNLCASNKNLNRYKNSKTRKKLGRISYENFLVKSFFIYHFEKQRYFQAHS